MKSFKIPMLPSRGLAMSLLGLCLFSGLHALPAHADFTFGEPVNLTSVIPVIDPLHDGIDCFSYDGLEIYVESDRPGGHGDFDFWVLRRASTDDDWGSPENLGSAVNSPGVDGGGSISSDGLTFFFFSNRDGGQGGMDIYMTSRVTRNDAWGQAVNMGPPINSPTGETAPFISSDGLELYFNSRRSGGYGGADLYVSKRETTNDAWGEPINLGPLVNSEYTELAACLSPDGLLLLFSDNQQETPRPGGYGNADMWMTRRVSRTEPWQVSVNLGPQVNSSVHDVVPRFSLDGSMLYFCTYSNGIWENWQASIEPVVDFNVDGIVDAADVCIMIEHWLTDDPLCDIGPMPWGDGIVDVQDLIVLAEHLFEEIPPVEEVE